MKAIIRYPVIFAYKFPVPDATAKTPIFNSSVSRQVIRPTETNPSRFNKDLQLEKALTFTFAARRTERCSDLECVLLVIKIGIKWL
jgi:hypothetical protein